MYNKFVNDIIRVKTAGDKVALDSVMNVYSDQEVFDIKRISEINQQGDLVYELVQDNPRTLKKSTKKK